jgi:hypothetical protein
MRTFLDALPGLGKTAEGNALISSVMQALEQHHQRAAEIASRAIAKEISPKQAEQELRNMPDPLDAWKKARGTSTRTWTPTTGVR